MRLLSLPFTVEPCFRKYFFFLIFSKSTLNWEGDQAKLFFSMPFIGFIDVQTCNYENQVFQKKSRKGFQLVLRKETT